MVSCLFLFSLFCGIHSFERFSDQGWAQNTIYTIFRKDRVDRRSVGMLMVFKYDLTTKWLGIWLWAIYYDVSHFFCGSNDFIWYILSSCRLPPAIRRHLSDADPFVNPTAKATIFAFCFLIMLIMNLLHLAAMQKFLFVVYLILYCLYLMSWLFCSTLILQRGLVLMEYSLYS